MKFIIRPAISADAEGMTTVHLQAWREAYAELMPESVFATQDADRENRVQIWREIIEGRSLFGDSRAYVAEVDGEIVGWATAGEGRDEDSPYLNELNGLYVLAKVYGTGIGTALVDAAVGIDSGAYVWALKDAGRANAFYSKMGFIADGTEKIFTRDGATLTESRLVRAPK